MFKISLFLCMLLYTSMYVCNYIATYLTVSMDLKIFTDSPSISCEFVNADPNFVVPNWRIVRRSDSGSVISNMTVSSGDVINNNNDGLEWVADTTSGPNNATYSRLVVGPVDDTCNQSSYQCIFATLSGNVESSIGTLTVLGKICVFIRLIVTHL